VLTFRCVSATLASRSAARIGAGTAVMLSLTAFASAHADTLIVGGCTWSRGAANCVIRNGAPGDPYVRHVPHLSEAEKARSVERDHKWIDRCRPIITQDAYGVPRYRYAAPGCEYGVIE
jgi:hypothetical protein